MAHKRRLANELQTLANELRYLRQPDDVTPNLGPIGGTDEATTAAERRAAGNRACQVEIDDLRKRLEEERREREEAERTIENYKASLRKDGEQSTMLLSSVEDYLNRILSLARTFTRTLTQI